MTLTVAEYHKLERIGLATRELDGRYYAVIGGRIVRVTIRGER